MGQTMIDSGLPVNTTYMRVKEIEGQTWVIANSKLYTLQGTTLTYYAEAQGRIYGLVIIAGEVYVVANQYLDRLTPYQTDVTKHYRLSGQTIASRVGDDLYYHISDPNGLTTLMADAQGNEIGYTLADPLGMVITNTLPTTLSGQLLAQLDNPNGLQHDGDRFYDPLIGIYLQPHSKWAPLPLPGAIHPYASTPLGPPGLNLASGSYFSGLLIFGLNKTLLSPGVDKWPHGLAQYLLDTTLGNRIDSQVPDFFINIGRRIQTSFDNTAHTVSGIPLQETETTLNRVFKLSKQALKHERENVAVTGVSFQAVDRFYSRHLNAGKAGRALLKGLPLFALDVAFNGFFQYRSESDLPTGLRLGRAVVGGLGNATVSAAVTGFGGLIVLAGCGATGGLGCFIAGGAGILAADFGLNLAFDAWIKEDALQIVGLGRKNYNQIIFHNIEY